MARRVIHAGASKPNSNREKQLRAYCQNYSVLSKFTSALLGELQGYIHSPGLPKALTSSLVNSFRIKLGNTDYHLVVEIPVCPQNQRLTMQTPRTMVIVELSLIRAGSPVINADLGYAFRKPVYKAFDPHAIQVEYLRLLAELKV